MIMPYTHITQVLVAEVKTKDQDVGIGENSIFRFSDVFL